MNSYTFHITLYDLAFLGAIFLGLGFAVLLWFAQNVNRGANRFLALALVTMVVWMIRILCIDIRIETYLPRWHWLPMQFLLALGPLMYFYVLKITRPQFTFRFKHLLHFSPLLLELDFWDWEDGGCYRTSFCGSIGMGTAAERTERPSDQVHSGVPSFVQVLDTSFCISWNRLSQPKVVSTSGFRFSIGLCECFTAPFLPMGGARRY